MRLVAVLVALLTLVQLATPRRAAATTIAPTDAEETPQGPGHITPPQKAQAGSGPERWGIMTQPEFLMSALVIAFGLLLTVLEYLLMRQSAGFKADDIVRVFTLTLIVMGTLFLVTAGYDGRQTAPAMGLFGTLAGYLVGRRSNSAGEGNPS